MRRDRISQDECVKYVCLIIIQCEKNIMSQTARATREKAQIARGGRKQSQMADITGGGREQSQMADITGGGREQSISLLLLLF
jgi:hypothetical protein